MCIDILSILCVYCHIKYMYACAAYVHVCPSMCYTYIMRVFIYIIFYTCISCTYACMLVYVCINILLCSFMKKSLYTFFIIMFVTQ